MVLHFIEEGRGSPEVEEHGVEAAVGELGRGAVGEQEQLGDEGLRAGAETEKLREVAADGGGGGRPAWARLLHDGSDRLRRSLLTPESETRSGNGVLVLFFLFLIQIFYYRGEMSVSRRSRAMLRIEEQEYIYINIYIYRGNGGAKNFHHLPL